jgi:hypothetical protein
MSVQIALAFGGVHVGPAITGWALASSDVTATLGEALSFMSSVSVSTSGAIVGNDALSGICI